MTLKLLVVDDSSLICARIARVAEDGSIDWLQVVATAQDGAQALEAARVHRPLLVTMDLTMPNLDGLACIPRLLEIDPDMRILVVSALNDRATALRALKLGARGFVHKPFSDAQLKRALTELLKD